MAELAAGLASRRDLAVTLVDKVSAHLWKPRLHEFAAGTVNSTLTEISFYILASMRGFRFEQGDVAAIDRESRKVRLAAIRGTDGKEWAAARDIPYDVCVVALGGVTPDFGTEGVADHAIRLDQKIDAEDFRDRFIAMMVRARETGEPSNIVIVGSGATGTELAAHLRLAEQAFFDDNEDGRKQKRILNVTILEAAPDLMPGADDELREGVAKRLAALEIAVKTGARINAVTADEVRSADGESWPSHATVWAAGLVGHPALKDLDDFEMDKKGRIVVDQHLRTSVDPSIYALGDAASLTPPGAEQPLPPTAQCASQQAAYLAEVLPKVVAREAAKPFRFNDKGRLLSLGGAGSVGLLGWRSNDDFFVDGQFATAAYHALQRRHQWAVLGPLRGSVAIAADMISPTKGPAMKLHG